MMKSMSAKRSSGSSLAHAITGLAAALVFAILVLSLRSGNPGNSTGENVNIGVEHEAPLTIEFRFAIKDNVPVGLVELSHEGRETIFVSLPESWERREVRGRSLTDTPSEDPSFGFKRWHMPEGATLSFRTPAMPRTLDIHNPSGVVLKIRIVKVDLTTGVVDRNVMLVKDAAVEIW